MAVTAASVSKIFSQHKRNIIIAACFLLLIAAVMTFFLMSRGPQVGQALQEQITRLEKAVKSDPHDVDMRVALALAYYQADSQQQAVTQLTTAINLNGNHQGALILLGDIYMDMERYNDAIKVYSKIVELNPIEHMAFSSRQVEGAYYQLGAAYYNTNNWSGAAATLENTLRLDVSDADAWHLLGKSYQKLGEIGKSVECFRKAVRYVPNYGEAYRSMQESFEKLGETNNALYAKAMVMYSSGSNQEAITQLEKITAEKPEFSEAFLGLGLAYEKAGQPDKAKSAYEKVLELDPENWLANAKLGR